MSPQSTGISRDKWRRDAQKDTHRSRPPTPDLPIQYAPLPDWFWISGMRRTPTYEALGRGDLRAIKLNGRTLIDVQHGLAFLAQLPEALITTGTGVRGRGGRPPKNRKTPGLGAV